MRRRAGSRARSGEFVALADLAPPRGGPPRLARAARRARIAAVLGAGLGDRLAEVRVTGAGVELVFEGSEWTRTLEPLLPELAPRILTALGRSRGEVVVSACAAAPTQAAAASSTVGRPASPRGRTAPARDEGVRDRLRRLGERLAARQANVDTTAPGK